MTNKSFFSIIVTMKILDHYPRLKLVYGGIFLFAVTLASQFVLDFVVRLNQQAGHPFTSWQSWLIVTINLIIVTIVYHWSRQKGLLPSHQLTKSDAKAIGWGLVVIFLMGFIGSNLMLLTHSTYHTSLQKTLTTIPVIPQAITMLTGSFLEELFFRSWLFLWFKGRPNLAITTSTCLFCLYHLPTNIGHFFLYLGMGLALSTVYQKNHQSYANILLHLIWNSYTLIATLLIIH